MNRRRFISTSAKTTLAAYTSMFLPIKGALGFLPPIAKRESFKLSLNQWSLWNLYVGDTSEDGWWSNFMPRLKSDPEAILNGSLDPKNFPKLANQLGFDAIEIEASLYYSKINDPIYFESFKKSCLENNVKCLFLCNGWEGNLASIDSKSSVDIAKNYFKWVDLCQFLGCHSLMVNVNGRKGDKEQAKRSAIEGLKVLTGYSASKDVSIIFENHNWFSADADWLVEIVEGVDTPHCRLVVDLGNFCSDGWRNGNCMGQLDPYEGVRKLMPYAKAVSAKTMKFNDAGLESTIDYHRMLNIIKQSKYDGYLGVEYSGDQFTNEIGIQKTVELITKVSDDLKE